MPRTQFEMSPRIFGQWRKLIKQTVNRLSANAMSGLQALPSLSNAATATASSFPSATIRVCSVFNQHRRVRVNKQSHSSRENVSGPLLWLRQAAEIWGTQVKNASNPSAVWTQLVTERNVFKTLQKLYPGYYENILFSFLNILKMHWCYKKSVLGQHANITLLNNTHCNTKESVRTHF